MLRATLVQLAIWGTLPLIPFRPFLGLLLYSWIAYMRPLEMAWLRGTTNSRNVAIALLLGLAIGVLMGREKLPSIKPQTILLTALTAWVVITGHTGVDPVNSEYWVDLFVKVVVICLVTTGLVQTRFRYDMLMMVIVFSFGLLGLKYGMFGLLRGGARFSDGPGGFMDKNNPFALALVMSIPLLLAVATSHRWKWVRVMAYSFIPFVLVTIAFTFSRGGLLALGVVSALLLVRFRRPVLGLATGLLAASLFFLFTSEEMQHSYIERADTIRSYEEDNSAMGRVAAWKTGLRMSKDYRVFGVGPRNFRLVYADYSEPGEFVRAPHSTLIQLLTENGAPGVVLYLLLMAVVVLRLERLQRQTSSDWIRMNARMIQISIAGYITAGLFLDMAFFDLYYHLIALSVSLEIISAVEQPDEAPVTELAPSRELAWWRVPKGTQPVTHQ